MNKKGENMLLGEKVLKIIVAVICLALLFGLAYVFYSALVKDDGVDQAKASLGAIVDRVTWVEDKRNITYMVESPDDWELVYFSAGKELPSLCNGDCLCMCGDHEKESCEEYEGLCLAVNSTLNLELDGKNYIKLEGLPRQMIIKRDGNQVNIFWRPDASE